MQVIWSVMLRITSVFPDEATGSSRRVPLVDLEIRESSRQEKNYEA